MFVRATLTISDLNAKFLFASICQQINQTYAAPMEHVPKKILANVIMVSMVSNANSGIALLLDLTTVQHVPLMDNVSHPTIANV